MIRPPKPVSTIPWPECDNTENVLKNFSTLQAVTSLMSRLYVTSCVLKNTRVKHFFYLCVCSHVYVCVAVLAESSAKKDVNLHCRRKKNQPRQEPSAGKCALIAAVGISLFRYAMCLFRDAFVANTFSFFVNAVVMLLH